MGGKIERGKECLEPFHVYPVAPDPVRSPEGDVGEDAFPAIEAREPESPSLSPFSDFFGVEPGGGDAGKAADKIHEKGRLSRAGQTGYEEMALFHGMPGGAFHLTRCLFRGYPHGNPSSLRSPSSRAIATASLNSSVVIRRFKGGWSTALKQGRYWSMMLT